MSDHITTYSGIPLTPLEPRAEDIRVRDIAHALSMMVRANGHYPKFYSVGQHCIACCEEARARGLSGRQQLACLLHDASEAYLSDITRPVKKNLANYREIEQKLQDCIFEKYLGGLTEEENRIWKEIDDTILYYEFECLMGEKVMECPGVLASRPVFDTELFSDTERKYLQLFERLYEA